MCSEKWKGIRLKSQDSGFDPQHGHQVNISTQKIPFFLIKIFSFFSYLGGPALFELWEMTLMTHKHRNVRHEREIKIFRLINEQEIERVAQWKGIRLELERFWVRSLAWSTNLYIHPRKSFIFIFSSFLFGRLCSFLPLFNSQMTYKHRNVRHEREITSFRPVSANKKSIRVAQWKGIRLRSPAWS